MKRREFLVRTAGLVGSVFPIGALGDSRPCAPPTLKATGGTSTTANCVTASPGGMPSWLSDKPTNVWFEVPNTRLSTCPPSQGAQYGSPRSKINAWCGAALRRKGSVYLIAAAGGHGDYGGNEVNALVLNSDSPTWVELRASSIASAMVDASAVYLDYRRAAVHTYNCTQFVNQDDRLVIMPYAGMGESALPDAPGEWRTLHPGDQMMCSFKAVNWTAADPGNDWDTAEIQSSNLVPRRGYYSTATIAGSLFNDYGIAKCGDPQTGDLYSCDRGYGLWKWTRATDSWSKVSSSFPWGGYGAAINLDQNARNGESFRRLLLVNGKGGGVYRSDTGAEVTAKASGLSWDVFAHPDAQKYVGIVFDEHNDRWLVFINNRVSSSGQADFSMYEVRYIGPASYGISEIPVAAMAGSTVPDTLGTRKQGHVTRNGIHNAVQYVPELRGVVFADQYDDNVHFMRVA